MSWLPPEQAAKHDITPDELAEFETFGSDQNLDHPERKEPTVTHKFPIDDRLYGRVKTDERTGLPAYPAMTASAAMKVRNAQQQLGTTADRLQQALAVALAQFEEAFAAEDRAAQTQARIDALSTRNQRRP